MVRSSFSTGRAGENCREGEGLQGEKTSYEQPNAVSAKSAVSQRGDFSKFLSGIVFLSEGRQWRKATFISETERPFRG